MALLALAGAAVVGALLVSIELWRAGRRLAQSRRQTGNHDPDMLLWHRTMVAIMGCLTLIAIILIEAYVRTKANPYAINAWLFGCHLLFDSMLIAVALAIVLKFNGKNDRRRHRQFVYGFYVLLALVVTTGSGLFYQSLSN